MVMAMAASTPSLAGLGRHSAAATRFPCTATPRRCARSQRSPPVVSAAAVGPQVAEAWFTATGVPLLESLRALTLQEAAMRCAGLVAATAAAAALGNWLIGRIGKRVDMLAEQAQSASGLKLLVTSALAAVHRPAEMLLPAYGVAYALLICVAFTEKAAEAVASMGVVSPVIKTSVSRLLGALQALTQMTQDGSELVIIVFVSWFALAWKDRLLGVMQARLRTSELGDDPYSLSRLLVPLSNLLHWAIVAVALLVTMVCWGINVRPLLAFGSVSTVAIGFAAQATMQNIVAALQIYTTQPFIVGDRVQLKSLGGATVVAGVVEQIRPMRTLLRTDDKVPVLVGNRDVLNLIVVNESSLRPGFVDRNPLVEAHLVLRYDDVNKVPEVSRAVEAYLIAHPLVDHTVVPRCVLSDFTAHGPKLFIKVLMQRSLGPRVHWARAEILTEAERLVREAGAYIAIEHWFKGEMPPPPPPRTDSERFAGGQAMLGAPVGVGSRDWAS